jgi:murein DD-endopeptidase MepM/ murein hydrolase activator NlpD
MSKTLRPAAFAAVLLVVALAAPTPAGAATRAQKAARSRQAAAAAAKLDALKASDRELSSAVKALNGQVEAQIARVNAAKRAAGDAEAKLASANAELQSTEDKIANLHGSVVAHAVDAYMRPQGRTQPAFNSLDLAEVSRQKALLAHVEKREGDALDELRAARQDLGVQAAVAARAQERASQRKKTASEQLNGLARNLKDKERLSSALEARIKDAQEEDSAANNGTLRDLIANDTFGGSVSKSGLIWPIKGRLTSGFGRRWGRLHAGIDIAAPKGTPIHAARAGKVIFSGWMGGYGNAVIINHGGGMATLYGHQSKRAAAVGDVVNQGEVIGYVGTTGHSTGNHLHFETRINGTPQNPRKYLP